MRKKRKIPVYNPKEIIFNFKRKGVPYTLEQTMFTIKINSKFGEMNFVLKNNLIRPTDLGFIGLVKRYCESKNFSINVDRKKIEYIHDGKLKKSYALKDELFEIDLTGAFWEFAYEKKRISKDIYERGLDVPKKVRLIALGNLAKRTLNLEFDGEKYINHFYTRSVLTESIFFEAAYLTDLLMRKLIILSNKSFLFYWVDAIFVQGKEAMQEIVNFLNDENVKHKVLPLRKIIKKENCINVWDDKHINLKRDDLGKIINEEGKRTFNFHKRDFINVIKK